MSRPASSYAWPSRNRINVMLCWIMAGMVAGALLQAMRVVLAPQMFVSKAKLWVIDHPPPKTACWPGERLSLVHAITETLQSPGMNRRARERMRALQPELNACEIRAGASDLGIDAPFEVTTAGTDSVYTQQHLDALLDEYMAFRREMRGREDAHGKPPPEEKIAAAILERASPAVMENRQWLNPLLTGAGAGMLGGFSLFYLASMGLALRALLAPS